MASAVQRVVNVATDQNSGGGSFIPSVRTKPIIISGNPEPSMVRDFIEEMFHPDHAEDAEDLHLIFLFPSAGPAMEEVSQFIRQKSNISIAGKVSVFIGSVLD